jgi:hypothetical protein
LLSNFGENFDVLATDVHGELESRVQLGERTPGELDVDNGASNTDDPSVL